MKDNYVKIENHPNLVKDLDSGAILNVDKLAVDQYKINRSKKILEEKRLNRMEDELANVKSILQEILLEIRNK